MKVIKENIKRGFTLIELIVVISIISVLSSVVMASLSSARKKANDSKVKQQLASLKSAAALYYSKNGTYGKYVSQYWPKQQSIGGGCAYGMFADPSLSNILLDKNWPYKNGYCRVIPQINSYAVSIPLSDGSFWCVDSSGSAVQLRTNNPQYFSTWAQPNCHVVDQS